MNQKQRATLFYMAAIIGVMILFPPYVVKNFRQVVIKSGYGFLFNLPPYEYVSSATDAIGVIPATVNAATLLMQIIGVLIVGGLICLAFRKP
jgi:hypothetical protein